MLEQPRRCINALKILNMYNIVFEMILFLLFISGFLNIFLESVISKLNYTPSIWNSFGFFIIVIVYSGLMILMLRLNMDTFILRGMPVTLWFCPIFLFAIRDDLKRFYKIKFLYFIPAIFFMKLYILINLNLSHNEIIKTAYFIMLHITTVVVMGCIFFFGFVCILKGLIVDSQLKYLVFFSILYWVVYTSFFVSFLILELNFETDSTLWNLISYLFLLIIVIFLTIENIVQFKKSTNYIKNEEVSIPVKYTKSKKNMDDLHSYKYHVDKLLQQEVYLIHDLNLDDLSHQLKIPKHYLTQVFSFVYQSNFKQIINKHRILYAAKLINEDCNKERIDDIAYSSGFSSKTSFYRAFKNEFNCTPLEFRKKSPGKIH